MLRECFLSTQIRKTSLALCAYRLLHNQTHILLHPSCLPKKTLLEPPMTVRTTTSQGRLLPTQQRSLVDVMPSNTTLDREFRLHHHVSRSSVLDTRLVASTDRTQGRTWSILEVIGASWGKGRVWLAKLHVSGYHYCHTCMH